MDKIRVFIADDHSIFREGLRKVLEQEEDIEVIGEAGTGSEAVEKAGDLAPDILLMDINMPEMNGLSATRTIKSKTPHIRIIILTVYEDKNHLFEAIKAGALGYLLKDVRPEDLLKTIRTVFRGEALLSPSIARQLLKEFSRLSEQKKDKELKDILTPLTKREKEILSQITEGKPNKEIANSLFISKGTVKKHIDNIFYKLHVNTRTEAALIAQKEGLT